MTRATNARLAGFSFLFYIAVAFPAMTLMNRAAAGDGVAAKLAGIAQHTGDVRLAIVLSLLGSLSALVLGVTLYVITRDQDPDVAMLGMMCRVGEGVIGAVATTSTLGLLWLATNSGTDAADSAATRVLGGFLLSDSPLVSATFFAVGSTLFSWLLLRGRMIPVALAWLGVVASLLLVVGLPLQLAGVLGGPVAQALWLPMAAFEIPLGVWLLIKGVATP